MKKKRTEKKRKEYECFRPMTWSKFNVLDFVKGHHDINTLTHDN